MSAQPNAELKLPTELLGSIFELVSPEALVVPMRCIALSESQNAMQMLKTTGSLVIDDFALYLEAWDGANVEELPKPFHYLLRVLRATTSLYSLKVSRSYVPATFSRRVDWESHHTGELLHTAGDPEFLPSLTLISVFNSSRADLSWFELLCYDRVIECYASWSDTDLHVKIFPALERSDAMAPAPHLSPRATSQLASYPKRHISGRGVGRLIQQSLDLDNRSNIPHLALLLQFPNVTLSGKPSPIHNTFSWLKDMFSMAGCPRLRRFHIKFKSPPLDWAASLDAQRLGLEGLQKIAPALAAYFFVFNNSPLDSLSGCESWHSDRPSLDIPGVQSDQTDR
ncbi:hypothetical protein RSAG8_06966, partial [Rhizoctonia solani AG-8 WAC10335]